MKEAPARQKRYELKMLYDSSLLFEIYQWVQLNPVGFITANPQRKVNNIYFDTHSMDCMFDHINGMGIRRKLRFRWYGEKQDKVSGNLEIKQKENRLGEKFVFPIKEKIKLLDVEWKQVCSNLINHSKGIFREMLSVTSPILINRYDREYYESQDRKVRLTLDYNHTVFDQKYSSKPNFDFRQPLEKLVVIEIKADFGQGDSLPDILAKFPLRVTQHSKYLESIDSIYS